jgi:hypothetical protein
MNGQQRTVGRCGTLLSAAVLLGLCGCQKASNTAATASSDGNGVAKVSWIAPTQNADGSKITDLVGYMIYYGPGPDNLNQSIEVTDPRATTYTVKKLKSGTTYSFSVVAFSAGGIRGGASATVSKKIP